MLRAGFVGLGKIGLPMALRLADRATSLAVFDVRQAAMSPLAARSARLCSSNAEVAQHSDVVCVAVLDDAQAEQVVAGPGGLLEGSAPGSVICLASTLRVPTILGLAERAAGHGVALIDTGVAGGAPSAETGTLVAMVGGDADAFARAKPLLEAFSKEVIHAGPLGSGMRLKLLKNHMSYLALATAHEARRLGEALGIEATALSHVVRETNLLGQFFHWGLERDGARRLDLTASEDALRHAREYSALARKDLAAVLELAAEVEVGLPFAECAHAQAGRYFLLPLVEDKAGCED